MATRSQKRKRKLQAYFKFEEICLIKKGRAKKSFSFYVIKRKVID